MGGPRATPDGSDGHVVAMPEFSWFCHSSASERDD